MAEPDRELSWDGVPEQMAKMVLQQGETFLQAQLQTAIAADQRAVTMASIFIAVATAAIGGALAYWQQTSDIPVLAAGLTAGTAMSVAACLCFWSARPIFFYFPGNQPDQWWGCVRRDLVTAIGGETENYQAHIMHNAECLAANGRAMLNGARLAIASPLLALLAAWLATSFCP